MTDKFFPEALYELGFTDLVSVIPPGAQLTPSSTINQTMVGKVPGRRFGNGLWAGYDWRRHEPTLDDVRKWSIDGANVGLRAGRWPAVDIDCTDLGLAQIIEDAALAQLGPAPIRIGRHPKRLLMYRTAEPFGRMRLVVRQGDVQHLVEILGEGQQYLVYGTHPATLKPYVWLRDPSPADLNILTREQADAFLQHLEELLQPFGHVERIGDGRVTTRSQNIDQSNLVAPSIDLLRQAVGLTPNNDDFFPGRDEYVRMGYAIKAAAGTEEEEGYAIFADWASRHESDGRVSGNPDTWLSDWRRMAPPYAVGWSWIAEQARRFGFDDAALDFEALEDAPSEPPAVPPIYSDHWLADKVVERNRGVLRYVPQKGCWLVWNNGRWQIDAELLAEDIVKRELCAIANHALRVAGTAPKEQKEAQQIAERICTAGKLTAVTQLVRSDRAIAVSMESLDHNEWILNTPGGIVDLKTGELHRADPDALCTKITAVPPDFSGACPEWKRFLWEATGKDEALERYLQRLCGYALTGSTREQQLTFIWGDGGNGKSVFLNVLAGVMGDYARVASMDTFTASFGEKHTTDVAMLVGARLVTASETQAGKRWDEARVKSLTGGEPVTARFMRQDNFTFLPQFKLVFVGNHKPEVRDVGAAMRRRIQMVPFTVTPARVDKELAAKLRDEWPAILAWMIEGCVAWQKEGLTAPEVVKAASEEYFETEDALGRWMQECLETDEAGTALTRELFGSWREWANGVGEYVGTEKRLASAIAARKLERWLEPGTRRRGFRGVKIKHRQDLGISL